MTDISPDQPEFRMLAQLAGCPPSKLAAAFNNPEHLFEHVTLEQLERFTAACARLTALSLELTARIDLVPALHAKKLKEAG